jgi:hypothetical protein
VIDRRHLFSLVGAVFAALALCVAPVGAGAAPHGHKAKPHKLTKRQKAAMRKQLRRGLARSPMTVLGKDFLKRAAGSDLNLPLTLRLARSGQGPIDDELGVSWTSETFDWPGGFAELKPAVDGTPPGGVIPLDGTSSLEAEFGNDTSGYVSPGVVETLTGGSVALDSGLIDPAIGVSDYGTDLTNNVPKCHRSTIQLSNVTFGTGRATQSLLHLFGGTARVTLHVRVGSTTQVVPRTDCLAAFGTTSNVYQPVGGDPIVPISFDATFKISPSVTADGKLRLGILNVPAGSTQPTTFARLTMCVDEQAQCTTQAFPSRLKVLQLDAEVLVGDVNA